jgi:hypothetical protein
MAVDIADLIKRLQLTIAGLEAIDGSKGNHIRADAAINKIELVINDLETLVDDGK